MTKFAQTYPTDLKYTEWQLIEAFFPIKHMGRPQNEGCGKLSTRSCMLMADVNTEQILASDLCHGSCHDFQLFKQSRSIVAERICILADSGYQGLASLHSNSQTPAKKSKLHPLCAEQKIANRKLSKKRILIENIIRKLKIFRILSERYRNR
jgi:transposase